MGLRVHTAAVEDGGSYSSSHQLWRAIYDTKLSSHIPQISFSLLHKVVMEHLLFRKLCARWVSKQLTPEHKAKHKESADISAAVAWWPLQASGLDNHKWWNMGCTLYARNWAAVNALMWQWISLKDKIQADFVSMENDVRGVLGQVGHSPCQLPDQRWDSGSWALLWKTAEIAMGHSDQAMQDA